MEFVKKNGKGILFCLMIAVPCQLLGKQFPIEISPVLGNLITVIFCY